MGQLLLVALMVIIMVGYAIYEVIDWHLYQRSERRKQREKQFKDKYYK